MAQILIVEDEAKMRRLLELDLGESGFETLSAADATLIHVNADNLLLAAECQPNNG